MLYFIGYLIKGRASEYQFSLIKRVAEDFGIEPLHLKLPTHLTLKAPFRVKEKEIAELEKTLCRFASRCCPAPISFKGFNHFGSRTIFIDVAVGEEARKIVGDLIKELRGLSWMEFKLNEDKPVFHASVARHLTPRQFGKIWDFISREEPPAFDLMLDNMTIFYYQQGRWQIWREFAVT